jgi:hypothetical protein
MINQRYRPCLSAAVYAHYFAGGCQSVKLARRSGTGAARINGRAAQSVAGFNMILESLI